jgi:hypothetical protein
VADRFSDPSWWPKPAPRPAPSGGKVAFAAALIVVVVTVVAINLVHAGHKSSSPACPQAGAAACGELPAQSVHLPVPLPATQPQTAREAFEQCMGDESGARRGRPGAGFRLRFELCRSLTNGGAQQQPASPAAPSPLVA